MPNDFIFYSRIKGGTGVIGFAGVGAWANNLKTNPANTLSSSQESVWTTVWSDAYAFNIRGMNWGETRTYYLNPNDTTKSYIRFACTKQGNYRRMQIIFCWNDGATVTAYDTTWNALPDTEMAYLSLMIDKAQGLACFGITDRTIDGSLGYYTTYSGLSATYGTKAYDLVIGKLFVPDPYAAGNYSTIVNTSSGTFDASSDSIAEPTLPTLSAQSGGLISLYTIDAANMATFANYLLSGGFSEATLKKLYSSPMEAILCLNYFPFTPDAAATPTEISIGKAGTGANGCLLDAQYVELDCGTVDIEPYYGSCLDQSPNTTITLVLPYCNAVDIDADEFMGKTVGVVYKIDCYTGACLAIVTADGDVLLQVAGIVANPLPISASNYSSIVGSIATVAVTAVGAMVAIGTGGVGTPAAIALAGGVAAAGVSGVMNAKIHYNHGGSGGMGTGLFGVQKPYLIIKRPRQCLPENNNNYQGYPSFVTKVLGNCYGFTKINEIHLDGISATDTEKKELESILKGGVWF